MCELNRCPYEDDDEMKRGNVFEIDVSKHA